MTFVIIANAVLAVGVLITIVGFLANSMVPSRRPRAARRPLALGLLGQSRRSPSHNRRFAADRQAN